ncbi:MAG: 6-phosphogluconolactonase [Thiohalomonadaceae bacterium]
MTKPAIHILGDEPALHRASAERVVQLAAASVHARGSFHLSLAGGRTPEGLYATLATPEFAGRMDWSCTHVYFGDERVVPPDHPDSNYRMARERLLSHVPLPEGNVHRIAGEQPAAQAAADYAAVLARSVPLDQGMPRFDLVLLGLGLDGHIASLFPDTTALTSTDTSVIPVYVEKLQAWRVSLTYPVLDRARHLILLVAGAKKADVVRRALHEIVGPAPLPVQRLRPQGAVEWFLDAQAAAGLRESPV